MGILIPPSINLIIYGLLYQYLGAETLPHLAGFVPGFLLALLFMGTVPVTCLIQPEFGGKPVHSSWRARLKSLVDLLPPLIQFMLFGLIYAGLATPTGAGALGVVCALVWRARPGRLDENAL